MPNKAVASQSLSHVDKSNALLRLQGGLKNMISSSLQLLTFFPSNVQAKAEERFD